MGSFRVCRHARLGRTLLFKRSRGHFKQASTLAQNVDHPLNELGQNRMQSRLFWRSSLSCPVLLSIYAHPGFMDERARDRLQGVQRGTRQMSARSGIGGQGGDLRLYGRHQPRAARSMTRRPSTKLSADRIHGRLQGRLFYRVAPRYRLSLRRVASQSGAVDRGAASACRPQWVRKTRCGGRGRLGRARHREIRNSGRSCQPRVPASSTPRPGRRGHRHTRSRYRKSEDRWQGFTLVSRSSRMAQPSNGRRRRQNSSVDYAGVARLDAGRHPVRIRLRRPSIYDEDSFYRDTEPSRLTIGKVNLQGMTISLVHKDVSPGICYPRASRRKRLRSGLAAVRPRRAASAIGIRASTIRRSVYVMPGDSEVPRRSSRSAESPARSLLYNLPTLVRRPRRWAIVEHFWHSACDGSFVSLRRRCSYLICRSKWPIRSLFRAASSSRGSMVITCLLELAVPTPGSSIVVEMRR